MRHADLICLICRHRFRAHQVPFREAVARLRARFPQFQFTVQRTKNMPRDEEGCPLAGDCRLPKDAEPWRIRIHAGLSNEMQIEVLLHEFAHVVDAVAGPLRQKDHGETWGLAYALVYRRYIEAEGLT